MRIIFLFLFSISLFSQEDVKTFLTKDGNKIVGAVKVETDSTITLITSFGEIKVNKKDIKPHKVIILLKDGNKIAGEVIKESTNDFVLKSSFGEVVILTDQISRIDVEDEESLLRGESSANKWYFGKERLVDIFFDPTGYTLEKDVLYISGLSWAYAINDKFDISSSFIRYFIGDLNIRPKWQIYKSGNIEIEKALAVGFHFHTAGPTTKQRFSDEIITNEYWDYYQTQYTYSYNIKEWDYIGEFGEFFPWGEVFTGYTISKLKEDKKGRINYHTGASLTLYPGKKIMPRVWVAVENDITNKLKVLGQVYYDPYEPSYQEFINSIETKNLLDVDFGFIYAFSENFHMGVHLRPYVILFYYKF